MLDEDHEVFEAARQKRVAAQNREERIGTVALCLIFLFVVILWLVPFDKLAAGGLGWLKDATALSALALIGLCVRLFRFLSKRLESKLHER